MNSLLDIEHIPGRPGGRFEPYVRLVHCLVPRTSYVAMFGPAGDVMWSTEPVTGPDLMNVVDDALLSARSNPDSPGQVRLLAGNVPVYLCSLRDDTKRLLAVIAIVCRASESQERKSPEFAFAYTLLSPMLECVRRELVSRATIDELNHTVGGLDRGMNLLLAYGSAEQSAAPADGANDLEALLQQTIEHLRARTGALLVPERNVTLVRAGVHAPADTQFLMRAHRRLLSLAQAQREPVVSNETLSAATPDALAYRVLCCSLRSRAGRFIGVLALLREAGAEAFTERDAHIAEILARKAIGVIESSYDALSGLYTRTAFERRVRAVITDQKASQAWSGLYIDVEQLQGRQGPRPQPRRGVPPERPEHRAPLCRHPHRGPVARGDRRRASASLRAAHPALRHSRHRPAALRAAAAHDRRGRAHRRAGQLPVGGEPLPADADHRSLGRQPCHRGAQAAPHRARGQGAGFRHQLLRAVPQRRWVLGLPGRARRRERPGSGAVLLRAHRERHGPEPAARRRADPAPAAASPAAEPVGEPEWHSGAAG